MQVSLFDSDKVGSGQREILIPARPVLSELQRMQRRIRNLEHSLLALEQVIREASAGQQSRHPGFDPEALAYLESLYADNPGWKTAQLVRALQSEAAAQGWRIGVYQTIYRLVAKLRQGKRLYVPPPEGGEAERQ
ncbi:MAG: hypothetical protein AB1402_03185 [Bacillota bacterium]